MKTYEITYSNGNDIYSANLVIAESAEQATAYYTAKGHEVIGCDETMSRPKPGQPIVTVPEGWTAPAAETEQDTETTPAAEPETETAETTETAQDAERDARIIELMQKSIDCISPRSAWGRGVKLYACELLDSLAECVEWAYKDGEPSPLESRETVRAALLNGAEDWSQYSWGGCSLIYNGDIAERLCSPSELKRKRGGELPPNAAEDWLDVQARALRRAAQYVIGTYDLAANGQYLIREGARA